MHRSRASPDPTPTDDEVLTAMCAVRGRPSVTSAYACAFNGSNTKERHAEAATGLEGVLATAGI